jgi:hypothetical protein
MIGSVWVTVPSAYWYVVKVGAVTVLLAWVIKIVVDVNVVVTVSGGHSCRGECGIGWRDVVGSGVCCGGADPAEAHDSRRTWDRRRS